MHSIARPVVGFFLPRGCGSLDERFFVRGVMEWLFLQKVLPQG